MHVCSDGRWMVGKCGSAHLTVRVAAKGGRLQA